MYNKNSFWRSIEVVITRTTRNRFAEFSAHGFESHLLRQPKARHWLKPCSCFFVRYKDRTTNKVTYANNCSGSGLQPPNPIFSATENLNQFFGLGFLFVERWTDSKPSVRPSYDEPALTDKGIVVACNGDLSHLLRQERFYLNPNRFAFSIKIIKCIFIKGNAGIIFDFERPK